MTTVNVARMVAGHVFDPCESNCGTAVAAALGCKQALADWHALPYSERRRIFAARDRVALATVYAQRYGCERLEAPPAERGAWGVLQWPDGVQRFSAWDGWRWWSATKRGAAVVQGATVIAIWGPPWRS